MSYPFVQAANDYGPRKGPVRAFVVHMAEGGGTVGFLSRPNTRGVSVHYVIEYSGRIVQMLREDRASGSINPRDLRKTEGPDPYGATVRKAVMGSWDLDPNSAVISLEIEGFAAAGPNDPQMAALWHLVDDVRSRYPTMGLLGHRDFQDYKACPGGHIPWSILGGHGLAGEAMVNFTAPIDEVGGTITTKTATAVIPIEGGTRPTLKAGVTRPAIGVFTLDDLDDRPSYLMLVGVQLCFVAASAVTFTPANGTTTSGDCSALEAKIAAAKAALA
jgi:hypothetical protein